MTPLKAKLYKVEYGLELLRIAQGDLESAQALHDTKKGRKENIGYLAQQSIEKSIKAVLCYNKIPIPHSHELAALLPLVDIKLCFPYGFEITDLSHYATIRPYMEGVYEVEDEEIEAAIEVAEKVLAWALGLMQ